MSKQKRKRRRIKFALDALEAKEVILAGDFNNWNLTMHPMKKAVNGKWNKTVMLPAGTYEYKFFIDGHWRLDPQNGQIHQNCFGSHNNILNIVER